VLNIQFSILNIQNTVLNQCWIRTEYSESGTEYILHNFWYRCWIFSTTFWM